MEPGAELWTALQLDLLNHLALLTFWSFLSLMAGLMILLRDRKHGFGVMTTAWAVVNLAIVWASLHSDLPTDPEAFRRFLAFNLGLNVLWIGVGVLMMRKRGNAWVAQAGRAMVLQAVVLHLLDLLLYWRTSR